MDKDHKFGSDRFTGTVSFYLDGAQQAAAVQNVAASGDTVSLTLDRVSAGDHTLTAVYSGSRDVAAATAVSHFALAPKALTWDVSGLGAVKKYDGNTAATVTGALKVSGVLAGTDPGFSYDSLAGTYAAASAGEQTVTVNVTGARLSNANCTLPQGKPAFTGVVRDACPPVLRLHQLPSGAGDGHFRSARRPCRRPGAGYPR